MFLQQKNLEHRFTSADIFQHPPEAYFLTHVILNHLIQRNKKLYFI